MEPSVRLIVALLVAPMLAAILVATGLTVLSGCFGYGCALNSISASASFGAMFGFFVGIPAAVLGGLPVHRLLVRTQRTHVAFYIAAGTLIGLPAAVAAIAFVSSGAISMPLSAWLLLLLIGGAAGAAAALLFWLIRRPDRDTANPDTATP